MYFSLDLKFYKILSRSKYVEQINRRDLGEKQRVAKPSSHMPLSKPERFLLELSWRPVDEIMITGN